MRPGDRDPDSTIERLERRLAEVERRLNALETAAASRPAPPEPVTQESVEPARVPESRPVAEAGLPLVGRTLVVLAGAFLLRALTEAGFLPQFTGTALGFLYAVAWIVLADRTAAKGRRAGATFHGVAAAIIGFPLLWEATVRFGFLSPAASATALTFLTGIALLVALRSKLRRLAWIFTTGAAVTALGLAVATKMLVLFAAFLLLLGLAALWLCYLHGWRGPAWLSAVAVDATVALMTVIMIAGRTEQVSRLLHPGSVLTLQLCLMVVYLGSFAARTLYREQDLGPLEVLQGGTVLLIGLGGAVGLTYFTALSGLVPGLVTLVLAAGCYGVSFAFIDRRLGLRTNFIFYTTVALTFALVAVGELLAGPARSLAFSAVALVAAWLGARRERATLSLHGAIYVVAAAASSGLLSGAAAALVETPIASPGWVTVPVGVALIAAAACTAFRVATHGRTWGRFSRGPKLAVMIVLVLGVDGVAVSLAEAALRGMGAPVADAGLLAAVRTAALAATAVALAAAARWARSLEASWLVYPVLLAGGLKLLLEDVRAGRAATMFVSLALFGAALILAPRLIRRDAPMNR